MTRLVLLAVLVLVTSCATPEGTVEARVRSALELLVDVVDPAYRLAVDGCIARERDAVRRFEAGSDPARDEYVIIKARCQHVRASFDAIREGHARAATLVDQGKLAEARAELEHVRAAFRALRAPEVTP